jgi:hypothetical protein
MITMPALSETDQFKSRLPQRFLRGMASSLLKSIRKSEDDTSKAQRYAKYASQRVQQLEEEYSVE